MNKIFTQISAVFLFAIFFAGNTFASVTYYAAPNGVASAAGTKSDPMALAAALNKTLTAGDSVIIRGGVYNFSSSVSISKSGSASAFLNIVNYPGEVPILDFRILAYGTAGVRLSGSYVLLKGITSQGAGDNGIYVTGSYNKIENCTARWNCDSGFQLKTGSNNLVLNCDSYENFDYKTGGISTPNFGGNADGFADKQYTNTGINTYKGCRSWRNSDDGWDSYGKIGNTAYDSCWCYANGPASYDMSTNIRFKTDSAAWFFQFENTSYVIKNYGNGNGFKLGGNYTANNTTLRNCVSAGNLVKGFDQNNNNGAMILYNCTSYKNGANYGFSNANYGTLLIKNSASLNSSSSNSFKTTSYAQSNNTWSSGFSCATADFANLDVAQLLNARQSDGSLPEITLLHLVSTSGMIDKGVDVGLPFFGTAPDLGAFEYKPPTSLFSTRSDGNMNIYPNPVNDLSKLSFVAPVAETAIIQILDFTGKVIIKFSVNILSGKNEICLNNAAALPKGNYICRVNGKSMNFSCKLIK